MSITIALVHSHYDEKHLEEVKAQMSTLGAPVIKAVWMECFGFWAAIEGCHRIRAAHALGIVPVIDPVDYSEDVAPGAEDGLTIAEICDASYDADCIEFA